MVGGSLINLAASPPVCVGRSGIGDARQHGRAADLGRQGDLGAVLMSTAERIENVVRVLEQADDTRQSGSG